MTRKPPLAALFALGIAVMAAVIAAMLAIPHSPYILWQSTRTEAFARLGWVYERTHYDQTPLDVALVGTSHTMNGIDGLAVAQAMAARGARTADGRCPTVTNLAIPMYGRNMHWAVAREALARHPKLLVLEVMENETRKPHPLYYRVASTRDLLNAPVILNPNYVVDLLRLPYRQLVTGIETVAPVEFGLKRRWSAADYDGSTVDNTRVIQVGGKALTPPWTRVTPEAKLRADAAATMASKNLHFLPKAWESAEYAIPDRYVGEILGEARRRNVPVVLLYLPGFGRPEAPFDMRLYAGAKMLTMNDILARTDIWHDPEHLNASGAALASERLAELLAPLFRSHPGGACQFGFPERKQLKPFRKET